MLPARQCFVILASLVALIACGDKPQGRAPGGFGGPVKVVTHTLELQPLVDEIQALGTARANESVALPPRVTSRVTRIAFEEREIVAQGDLLVELENSEIKAELARAEASLSESLSLYNPSKELTSTQAISESNLETLLAQVKVNEANVEAQKAKLRNTRVLAPFAGRVGLRRVSPGSFVDTSTVITTLDDVATIKLDFTVPETFITVLSDGMKIIAHSIVYPDRLFEGRVTSIDTRVDPVTRAIQVRAVIPNDDRALKPGMFITVDLQRDRGNVLIAPEQAIVPEGSSQYVFVVSDGIAEKRAITLGRRVPGYVVIADGLQAGETVITEGTSKVRDGSAVQGQDQAAATGQPPRAGS